AASHEAVVSDTLVTFGAGTNKLASLMALSRGLGSATSVNPAYSALGALMVAVIVIAWLMAEIATEHTTSAKALSAIELWVGAVSAAILLFAGLAWVITRLSSRWEALRLRRQNATAAAGVIPIFSAVIAMVVIG